MDVRERWKQRPPTLDELSAVLSREDHGPLPEAVRAELLDAAELFAREFDDDGPIALSAKTRSASARGKPRSSKSSAHSALRASVAVVREAVRARSAVFVARALLSLSNGGAFDGDASTDTWMRARNLVGRILLFAERWRTRKRRRNSPRRPDLDQLTTAFGPDARLVDALWPAIRFFEKAALAEIAEDGRLWSEADHLHVALSPQVEGHAVSNAAKRTRALAYERGEQDGEFDETKQQRAAVARVMCAVQKKRDAILDVYEPSGDVAKVANYVTVIARRAVGDQVVAEHSAGEPRPSTLRNYRRCGRLSPDEPKPAERARALLDEGLQRQRHAPPDVDWVPLSLVAADLAGRYGCRSRTVYSIFHRERDAGRLEARKGTVAYEMTTGATRALAAAVKKHMGRR